MKTFKIIESESVHIVYWFKNNVLFFRTSNNTDGSMPVEKSPVVTLGNLLLSLGYKNYTTERI
jgi:hypothetical protein